MEKITGVIEKKIREASWNDVENMVNTFRHVRDLYDDGILCSAIERPWR